MYMYLFLALTLLNILDIVTTYVAITHPYGVERNPVVKYVIEKVGILPGLFLLKILFLAIVYIPYHFQFLTLSVNINLVFVAIILYVAIVVNNIIVLKKLSEIED